MSSSSKFTPQNSGVRDAKDAMADVRVVKLDVDGTRKVEAYEFGHIDSRGSKDYDALRKRFGSLAATDSDRATKSRKDGRFLMNPALRENLSIDEEEKRAIEERVNNRISEVADEVRARAKKEGYEEGLRQGEAKAYREFQEASTERIARFDVLLGEFEGLRGELYKANERFLVDMVFHIAQKLLLKELAADRQYVIRLVQSLIEASGARENIWVKISATEIQTIEMVKAELLEKLGQLTNLRVEASPEVQTGGCLLETSWSAIDARIETQLEEVHKTILAQAEQSSNGGERVDPV